jgi:hypothetical protein
MPVVKKLPLDVQVTVVPDTVHPVNAQASGELKDKLTVKIAVVRSSFGFEKRFAVTQLNGAPASGSRWF